MNGKRVLWLLVGFHLVFLSGATADAQSGAPPEITSLSDTALPRSGLLHILGANFGTQIGDVQMGGVNAVATTWSDAEIHAYVPESAPLGSAPVQVITAAGSSNAVMLTITARQPDGRVRWRFRFDSALPGQHLALAADGTIYATDSIRTYALAPDGGLKWVLAAGGGGRPIAVGADGTIYTGAGGIVAIRPDGTIQWEFIPPGFRSTIAGPGVGADGNLYAVNNVLNGGIGVYSLDSDGNLRWFDPGDPAVASFPGSNSEIAFSRLGDDRFFFGVVTQGSSPPALWSFSFDGTQEWHLGSGCESFPMVDPDNRVIVAGQGGCGVTALNRDGAVVWNAQPPQSVGQLVQPAVGPDGTIYTADFFGEDFWALNPDGSTRWFLLDGHGFMAHLGVSPDNAVIIDGGQAGFGVSGWVRGYDTADGALLFQVDLLPENGLDQSTWTQRPVFSSDSRTAYVTTRFAGSADVSYLYAIDISTDPGEPPGNKSPIAVAAATPSSGLAPLTVNFDSTGSSDPDGTIVAHFWDFGDGNTSVETQPTHVYASPGAFIATLTVADNQGATGSDSVTIEVTPSGDCTQNCLRSTDISLSARARRKRVTVTAKITVEDETGSPVRDAAVHVRWVHPDGSMESQRRTTGRRGKVRFKIRDGRGTYSITITDIALAGWTFDPANSVTTASITRD